MIDDRPFANTQGFRGKESALRSIIRLRSIMRPKLDPVPSRQITR